MKSHDKRTSGNAASRPWKMFGSIVAACSLLVVCEGTAVAASITGGSETIFRLRGTQNRDLYPLYEYLHFSVAQPGVRDGFLTFNMGGWGRLDLVDKTTDDRVNGDLQYGYLSYRGNRNNLYVNVGRLYVNEGVAHERVDGASFKSDLTMGFQGSVFAGRPVVTEPNALAGGDVIYGGRIAHSVPNLYTLGLSALKTSQVDGSTDLREEEAIDLWLHPVRLIDLAGTSSFDSRTGGWMEHTYRLTFGPWRSFRVNGELSRIDYKAYFHHTTTPAFSFTNGIINPNEEVMMLGGSVGYPISKNLDLVGDYRHYDYELAGDAHYFGAKLTYVIPDSYSAGIMFHRMDGFSDRLRYNEFRLYASKRMGKADFTVDLFDVDYDRRINGISNSFSASAAAGYQFSRRLRGTVDLEYQRNPDYDNQIQGLVKLVYAFDMTTGAEGRAK